LLSRAPRLDQIGGSTLSQITSPTTTKIGRAIRHRGQRVSVLPLAVIHPLHRRHRRDLFSHELRWSRTVRVIRPWSHLGTIIHPSVPAGAGGSGSARRGTVPLLTVAVALLARFVLKFRVEKAFARLPAPPG